jgi:hypothetical protein
MLIFLMSRCFVAKAGKRVSFAKYAIVIRYNNDTPPGAGSGQKGVAGRSEASAPPALPRHRRVKDVLENFDATKMRHGASSFPNVTKYSGKWQLRWDGKSHGTYDNLMEAAKAKAARDIALNILPHAQDLYLEGEDREIAEGCPPELCNWMVENNKWNEWKDWEDWVEEFDVSREKSRRKKGASGEEDVVEVSSSSSDSSTSSSSGESSE